MATDARVTAVVAEVVVAGATPPVRVSSAIAEVMVAGAAPPVRATSAVLEVMALRSTASLARSFTFIIG